MNNGCNKYQVISTPGRKNIKRLWGGGVLLILFQISSLYQSLTWDKPYEIYDIVDEYNAYGYWGGYKN